MSPPSTPPDSQPLRLQVGVRLRARRHALGWTIARLAQAAAVSVRYVTQAEHGDANLSLAKLDALARSLQVSVASLVSEGARGRVDALLAARSAAELDEIAGWLQRRFEQPEARLVALLGVRGAGKSSVGRRLATRLARPFIELDQQIATRADLPLAELFAVHGEAYYRRLEAEALAQVAAAWPNAVLATGGSIVTHPENFAQLRAVARTVWLKATPEAHWDRVIQQGDRRPMRDHPHAMAELRALLASRAPLYQQADVVVDTAGVPLAAVVDAAVHGLASHGSHR